MQGKYEKNGTKVTIDYGEKEPVFKVKIGDFDELVEEASESTKATMRKLTGVVTLDDLDWNNIMVLDLLCKIYYDVIIGEIK
jgi:hypothetical protein